VDGRSPFEWDADKFEWDADIIELFVIALLSKLGYRQESVRGRGEAWFKGRI